MEKDPRDYASNAQGGMSLPQLERLLSDAENEPQWRAEADKCADYYDHKQASAERVARSQETGEPLSITNLIQRTINGALGQEAKSRLGWKVEADSQAFGDVATVLNEGLHEAQRETRSDMAISDAYSSQLRAGIGWVEVARNADPLAYPYRVTAIHRNEVWWDWRAKLADKSDARWMLRQRWVDLDEAAVKMPQHRELFDVGCHSGPITDVLARAVLTSRDRFDSISLTRHSFSRTEEEWLDNSSRRRVRFYSVYYKQPKEVVALAYGTRRVQFNPRNPLHVMLAQSGAAQLIKGPSYEIRHAMFAGPFRLVDEVLPGRRFPLVPFVCYSCDDDFSPYGLVHGMIGPQDEFNERRSRLLWLLKAKQVFADNDALDPQYNNFAQVAQEVMRPDAFFVLNANRRNANGLQVVTNLALQKEQADVMMNAQQLIQEVPGVYNALLGNNRDGITSGVALNNLVEQSVTSLGETSDNYRTSRQVVGELLSELRCQDLRQPNIPVEVGSGRRRRTVVLNTFDQRGVPVNHVEDAATRVALGDVPQTQAYKAQQQINLSNMAGQVGNDPIARPVLVAAMLEASDLEHGAMYAKWIRQKVGIPDPMDMTEDTLAQMEQQSQQQAAQQGQAQQAALAAEIADKQANAQQKASTAELNQARVAEIIARLHQQPAANKDQTIQDALAEAHGQSA